MKLPVFKAFAAAIAYFATHILTIVKILWLPLFLLMAALVYLMPDYIAAALAASALGPNPDPAEAIALIGPMMSIAGLLLLANAIFYPMMIAGILRHVVRGESPRLPFYLQFGGDELRILLTFLLLAVMVGIVYVVGILGVVAVSAALVLASKEIGGVISAVLVIAFSVALIWFLLRMSLALPAAVGAKRIGIAVSWAITKGNSWRLFFYWLLWVIVAVLAGCLYLALIMPEFFSIFGEMSAAADDPAALKEIEQRMTLTQLEMWDRSKPGFWTFIAGNYVASIASLGLTYSATGVAYRYLTKEE